MNLLLDTQAQAQGLTLITRDRNIRKYDASFLAS